MKRLVTGLTLSLGMLAGVYSHAAQISQSQSSELREKMSIPEEVIPDDDQGTCWIAPEWRDYYDACWVTPEWHDLK